jgi:hypothetical protein
MEAPIEVLREKAHLVSIYGHFQTPNRTKRVLLGARYAHFEVHDWSTDEIYIVWIWELDALYGVIFR